MATWNGRISPVLDVARQIAVMDVEAGRVMSRRDETLPGTDPRAQAARLAEIAPEVLICGAVSRPMADSLVRAGIRLVPFVAGTTDRVCSAWLAGRLPGPGFNMPGCQSRGRCHRGCGRGRGHGGSGRREVNDNV